MADDIRLTLHNDGKQKWQSFEMSLDVSMDLTGYGENEAEARAELEQKVNVLIDKLKAINFDSPEIVDYSGKPIPKFW